MTVTVSHLVSADLDPGHLAVTEPVQGSRFPVHLIYVEMVDGVYTPIGLRKPEGPGPFPIVLCATGNGGGGMTMLRDHVHNKAGPRTACSKPATRPPGCATAPRSTTPMTGSAS